MKKIVQVFLIFISIFLISCEKEPFLELGMEYQGGRIFYLDKTGKHGLIAAPEDLPTYVSWGCANQVIPGTNFTFIGAGMRNTNRIIEVCQAVTAASLCADLVIDGYDDWYLPSKDELLLMYVNRDFIGNLRNGVWEPYWSSSQYEPELRAIVHNFGTGLTTNENKANEYWVRAIRSF
ncbi:Lcl domain-containing protein [Belliella aquatica]|uniref:Lcl C-terminal domain-containing protein n=1 Tax=Belliella aquatica TaxID=1323734 RepID=A0ABQ1MGN7_9BACT|nr:DUF1566 domain-containing protein [Belliella aquatica]MCH7405272.1 DUF1566 domain-containing protein [Belliella aquatica]GGC38340.1 hypothetical protein GCM10010993_16450 [Belliella aquatica]